MSSGSPVWAEKPQQHRAQAEAGARLTGLLHCDLPFPRVPARLVGIKNREEGTALPQRSCQQGLG